MPPRKPLWKRLLAVVSVLLIILGTVVFIRQKGIWPDENHPTVLAQFTKNDVFTKIEVRKHPSGHMELLSTFTPTREHFHLYSKDLPGNGLHGLGRPTLLEIIPSNGIQQTGLLTAYQETSDIYLEVLGLPFPVYPEGPVVLGLPFELVNKHQATSVELSVTYMACSDQTCLPPVIDKRITVEIPGETLQQH